MRVANAPCSWGVLEFDPAAARLPASEVLDEIAATGYEGSELGDWGFLPPDPAIIAAEMRRRALAVVGAFVPVALARPECFASGLAQTLRTARLLAGCGDAAVVLVISDDNATVPHRTRRAGRIDKEDGLSDADWDGFASRAEQIAREVRRETGVRTAFHPHCAGFVETAAEIDALMTRTDPAILGLCLDTGHLTYAGGDPAGAVHTYGARIWHVHLKDCDPRVAGAAREQELDYHAALGRGVFCELGRGAVAFPDVLDGLRQAGYDGWLVVEQDVLPGRGTPAESARRNREYLRTLGV